MAERIIPNSTNIQGVSVPLISFDCVVDTDFGLLLLIYKRFFDKEVFSEKFFAEHHQIKDLVWSIYDRDELNPLWVCATDEYKETETLDNFYKEFMDKYYADILNLSMPTGIADFVYIAKNNSGGDVAVTIVYKNDEELNIIRKLFGDGLAAISLSDANEKMCNHYQQFFFKYKDDEYANTIIPHLRNKTIYLAEYHFNRFSENDPNTLFRDAIENRGNNINIIEMYSRNKLMESK